jgi:hypothetical protein
MIACMWILKSRLSNMRKLHLRHIPEAEYSDISAGARVLKSAGEVFEHVSTDS